MSWFDATGFANLAKNALKEAQKTIDKALISDGDNEETEQTDNANEFDVSSTGNSLWDTLANTLFEKSKADINVKEEIKEAESDSIYEQPTLLSDTVQQDDVDFDNSSKNIEDHLLKYHKNNIGTESDLINTSTKLLIEDNANLTASGENNDILSKMSMTSHELEADGLKGESHCSYESSIEVLSFSFAEGLNTAGESSNAAGSASSESVEIIRKITGDTENENMMKEENDYTSLSQSTLTTVDCPSRPFLNDIFTPNCSLEPIISEIPSLCDSSSVDKINISELSKAANNNFQSTIYDLTQNCDLSINNESAENSKRTGNRISITLDGNSSCDDSTIVDSDEPVKEDESSICSLKNILTEAMNDHNLEQNNFEPDLFQTHREESPFSADSRTKVGSSGHTSGDELETATSSDIEIISSPNGDSSNTDSRQSPAKLIYRSSNGKMSVIAISDNLIPEISGKYVSFKVSGHNREPSETSSGCSDDSVEIDRLLKKIAELSEILEARESKLIDLSMKNAELSENNSNLKSQLECQMNEEFSQRLMALEKKFQQAIRERDLLRKQLETYKQNTEADENKDQIIKELREEGEKLSKQQLAANVLIKKLRTTEKDHLKLISSLREQYDGIMTELERAKKSLNAKESIEKSQIDAINQLTVTNQKLEKQAISSQSQIENLTSTLITVQKDQQEKEATLTEFKNKLDALTAERKEETIQKLEEELIIAKNKQKELQSVISELRQTLRGLECRYSSQEAALRQENSQLLLSLERYKQTDENFQEKIVEATKPITRQLTDEITKYNKAAELWEKKERHQNKLISELEEKVESSNNLLSRYIKLYEGEKENSEKYKCLFTEQSRKVEEAEAVLKRRILEVESLKSQLERLNSEVDSKKSLIKATALTDISVQTEFSDDESIDYTIREDQFNFPHTSRLQDASSRPASPTLSIGRISLSESSNSAWPMFADDEPGSSSSQIGSIYDGYSRPIATATSVIENMQAQIKQREGEIQQLQWELTRRDHERNTLINEVSKLTTKVTELEPQIERLQLLQREYDELLQMYGEKAEAYKELQMDIADIKEIHKLQITQLVDKYGKEYAQL